MANFLKGFQAKKSIEAKLSEQSQALGKGESKEDQSKPSSSDSTSNSTALDGKNGEKRFQQCTNLVRKATEAFQDVPLLTNAEIKEMYDVRSTSALTTDSMNTSTTS